VSENPCWRAKTLLKNDVQRAPRRLIAFSLQGENILRPSPVPKPGRYIDATLARSHSDFPISRHAPAKGRQFEKQPHYNGSLRWRRFTRLAASRLTARLSVDSEETWAAIASTSFLNSLSDGIGWVLARILYLGFLEVSTTKLKRLSEDPARSLRIFKQKMDVRLIPQHKGLKLAIGASS
jgi:hypothetical protein